MLFVTRAVKMSQMSGNALACNGRLHMWNGSFWGEFFLFTCFYLYKIHIFKNGDSLDDEAVNDSSTDERLSNDRPAVIVADLPEDVGNAGGDADPDTEQVKAADFLCNCKLSNGTPSSTRHSVKELLASRS